MIWLACGIAPLQAQEGDRAGEIQESVVPRDQIPPAPVLSPADALKSFTLQPGFRIELVAAEPLIHDPIQIAFGPDGRLWVLEMRGFMPNPAGQGEFEKVGSVALLEDTDEDGRMDKRTTFLEGLVMPRAIALHQDGLLVAEPPMLWFCRDTDGDGRSDEQIPVASDYATQVDPKLGPRANVEHAANGLLRGLDNWIYSANYTTRFRPMGEGWGREPTRFRGQWGISQDDTGRLFYNSNEDPLRADLVPAVYLNRNPNLRNAVGANVRLYEDKAVFPIRVNPGVNRGYRPGQLRPDGTLATFTAACAPFVYRGDALPQSCRGAVYVCEPSGNLIRQFALVRDGFELKATNAYPQAEFLASTDERFRPVNLASGPDGALYIVDLYRGIIQHRIFLTTSLRNQSLDRGLEQPIGLGRIYRVVADDWRRPSLPNLTDADLSNWIDLLSSSNGWHRDTAQRLLVDRADPGSFGPLKRLAASGSEPLGRLHALWTLEGLRALDAGTLLAVFQDPHPSVRAAGLRVSELQLSHQPRLMDAALRLQADSADEVQLQLALTLGQVKSPQTEHALTALAARHATSPYLRDAILTGIGGRELEILETLLPEASWRECKPGYPKFMSGLSRCVFNEGRAARVSRMLEIVTATNGVPWQRQALLKGMIDTAPPVQKDKPTPKIRPVRLAAEPPGLKELLSELETASPEQAALFNLLLTWPGKPGEVERQVRALDASEQAGFNLGRELFAISCAPCHQPHGLGQDGLAPPLVDSEWVLGSEQRLARMILHGVRGRITVRGQTYDMDMPSFGSFDDAQIAALMTYVRREWDHEADPVRTETVTAIRQATDGREEAWSEAELLAIE